MLSTVFIATTVKNKLAGSLAGDIRYVYMDTFFAPYILFVCFAENKGAKVETCCADRAHMCSGDKLRQDVHGCGHGRHSDTSLLEYFHPNVLDWIRIF